MGGFQRGDHCGFLPFRPPEFPSRREDTVFSELWIVGSEELLPDDKAQGGG